MNAYGGRLNTTLMLLEQMKQDLQGIQHRMRSEQNSAPGAERTMADYGLTETPYPEANS